jgi:zinc transporter ZupT
VIPESIVVGVSMISGGAVSWVTVAAIFLSNIPEGLSSAAGMKKAGRSIGYVFGVWGAIAVISGISALLGYTLFGVADLWYEQLNQQKMKQARQNIFGISHLSIFIP